MIPGGLGYKTCSAWRSQGEFCLLTACSASTAAPGISFQTISSIGAPTSIPHLANPGLRKSSLPALLEISPLAKWKGPGLGAGGALLRCVAAEKTWGGSFAHCSQRSAWNLGKLRGRPQHGIFKGVRHTYCERPLSIPCWGVMVPWSGRHFSPGERGRNLAWSSWRELPHCLRWCLLPASRRNTVPRGFHAAISWPTEDRGLPQNSRIWVSLPDHQDDNIVGGSS